MRRDWVALATIAAIALVAMTGIGQAEPLTIRVGWVVTPGHLAPLIEALGKRQPGVFKHLGRSYVMQAVHFQGTSPQIQAQAIGEIEVAAFSTAALALAITNAQLRRAGRGRRGGSWLMRQMTARRNILGVCRWCAEFSIEKLTVLTIGNRRCLLWEQMRNLG